MDMKSWPLVSLRLCLVVCVASTDSRAYPTCSLVVELICFWRTLDAVNGWVWPNEAGARAVHAQPHLACI